MTDNKTLWVVGASTGERAFRWPRGQSELTRGEVNVGKLRQQVNDFVTTLGDVLATIPEWSQDYLLQEITVSAEITAKGNVNLLGCGGEVGGSGGLTFTFVRSDKAMAVGGGSGHEPTE